jgi:hypothetical protein
MDDPVGQYWSIRLERLEQALRANNFEVFRARDPAAAGKIVLEAIVAALAPRSVSFGGSTTLIASGVIEGLRALPKVEVIETFDTAASPAELTERRRRALTCDLFFAGANAVTEAGQLVNMDMIGNRTAPMQFGPRHVVVLAGRNKLVADLEAARARIKTYAAPVNAMRLDKKTPCVKTARCEDCKSPERICNAWGITEKSFPPGRIKVVLIDQECGL